MGIGRRTKARDGKRKWKEEKEGKQGREDEKMKAVVR